MNLKDKLEEIIQNAITKNKGLSEGVLEAAEDCEKAANEFAKEFANWCIEGETGIKYSFDGTLEDFKKESGL